MLCRRVHPSNQGVGNVTGVIRLAGRLPAALALETLVGSAFDLLQ